MGIGRLAIPTVHRDQGKAGATAHVDPQLCPRIRNAGRKAGLVNAPKRVEIGGIKLPDDEGHDDIVAGDGTVAMEPSFPVLGYWNNCPSFSTVICLGSPNALHWRQLSPCFAATSDVPWASEEAESKKATEEAQWGAFCLSTWPVQSPSWGCGTSCFSPTIEKKARPPCAGSRPPAPARDESSSPVG